MHVHPTRADWIAWAIIGGLSGLLFIWVTVFNWVCAWMTYVRKVKYPSIAPLVGGLAGSMSLLLFPLKPIRYYAWLPLILDIGCVPYFLVFTAVVLGHKWHHNRFTVAARFRAHYPRQAHADLVLYNDGTYMASWKSLCGGESGDGEKKVGRTLGMAGGGEWTRAGDTVSFGLGENKVVYELQTDRSSGGRPVMRLVWCSGQTMGLPENVDFDPKGGRGFREGARS